ncbi:MAG TPA: hypothetical protein VMD92_13240 [Acidobacteriaceae bacterium]|nr:hypothetical protein [Acidobacteriaceae bacterium]
MPYASNNNAILIDNCNNLQNLTVLLEVTEDLATTNNGGWSLQLNCYAPPGQYCQTSQVNVLQYIVIVQGGILQYYIQYWAYGTSTWPSGYNPQPGTSPWLPCWAHDYGIAPTFATGLSGDTLPRESTLQIALATNSDGGVTTATFTYTDPDDNVPTGVWKAPAVLPICAFQLNFVGPPGGTANFTQGLLNSRGIIYYTISSGELSVQSGGPGSACGEPGAGTAETSNMTYSDINGAPASTVTQILQQPIPCVIDSVYLTDPAHLGEMKQLRDTEVAKVPAGQWLLEVLDRHSADLALIVAANDVGLGRPARDLLTRAVQIAREGRVFDEAAIDEAMKVWEQVSCKLPPSMNGVGPAGATVLRSLRGRTFQEGLKEASRTIRPRFKAARK